MNSVAHNHSTSTMHRDDTASKLGMWLLLFIELLFFGGLFLVYAVYRSMYSDAFHLAALELNTLVGTINTIVLLASSFTVVLAIAALQRGHKRTSVWMLVLTICLAGVFMVNKYFEWMTKIHHGFYPGSDVMPHLNHGEILFYGLYFIMTGFHALHVLIGVVLLAVVAVMVSKNRVTADNYVVLENSGLYWHLVDLIWIYLFPLFYLIK